MTRCVGRLLILAMMLVMNSPPVGAQILAQAEPRYRELAFLTLRNRLSGEKQEAFYGNGRSTLKAGFCRVRDRGPRALSSLAEASPSFIRDDLLQVDRVSQTKRRTVLDRLQETVADGNPLLYVHGYNISFEKGCRRAVLLQENASASGRLLWFSWPSDGALANYTRDEADLYWSVPDITEAMIELARRFGSGRVNVAGHSLGARGTVLALSEMAFRAPDVRLGHIVLLAADMDFGIFKRMLPRIRPLSRHITVYVSDADRPLALSRQIHGYPRLGEADNDVSQLAGVEVIDLSRLESESPSGHLYHTYNPAVGGDLAQLLNEEKLAPARRNLLSAGGNRWILLEDSAAAR